MDQGHCHRQLKLEGVWLLGFQGFKGFRVAHKNPRFVQAASRQLADARSALDWTLARSYVGTPFEALKDLPAGLHIALEEGLATPAHRPDLARTPWTQYSGKP